MISNSTFLRRFTKVDDLTRQDHYYLTGDDACYFIGEYTACKGHAYSVTNQLILNFKKPMDRHGRHAKVDRPLVGPALVEKRPVIGRGVGGGVCHEIADFALEPSRPALE